MQQVLRSERESGTRSFASPRLIRLLAGLVGLIGVLAAVGGMAYAFNAGTRAGAHVVVPVSARDQGAVSLDVPGLPEGSAVEVSPTDTVLRAWDSTVAEQLLSRGHLAVLGLCVGLGALLLRGLLLSIAQGRPFDARNPARIAGIAGLVVVGGLVSAWLPGVATDMVLSRLGLTGPDSPLSAPARLDLLPLLVAPVLLALAEAFRRGGELARDVDGLV